jgi:hypothetical protein
MVALGVAFTALTAFAQHVALVRPNETEPALVETFNRLNAELRLQHFAVTVIVTDANLRSPGALEEVAKRVGAAATVIFVRHDGRTAADIWIDGRGIERSSVRTLDPTGGAELPNVLAIRAVDLLRTSLREPANQHREDAVRIDHPPIADSAIEVPPQRLRSWEVRAEGLLLWDGPALGPVYGAALGASRRLSDLVAIGLLVSGPLVGASWETGDGAALVRQHLALAEIKASWWHSKRLELGASLAAGSHYLNAQGTGAKLPFASKSDEVWSFAGAIAAFGNVALTPSAKIGLTVRAVGVTPKPGVGVGNDATVLQWPLLGVSAGLVVGF